jgi:hypothetical protein
MKEVKQIAVLWALMVMAVSCSQSNQPIRSTNEVGALSKSLFDSGSLVPDNSGLELLSASQGSYTDGGFIAPPSQTGTSSESGVIASPTGEITNSGSSDISGGGDSTLIAGIIPNNSSDSNSGTVPSVVTNQTNSGIDSGNLNGPLEIPGVVDTGALTPGTIPGVVDTGALTPGQIPGVVDNGALTPGTIPGVVDTGALTPGQIPGVIDTGALTPGQIPGAVDNGTLNPSSSTGSCSQPQSSPKPSCSCSNNTQPKQFFNVSLSRVCSLRRSSSKDLFFEDAKNPILTIEAVSNSKADPQSKTSFLASVGFSRLPAKQSENVKQSKGTLALAVASLKLEGVDLLKGKFSSKIKVALNDLKTKLGASWRFAYLNVRVCEDSNQDGFCFDEAKKNQLAFEVPSFKASALPKNLEVQVWSGRYLTLANNPYQCERQYSPLVFDLKGDGLNLIGPEAGVQFDINDVGSPIPTGWIGKTDEALLVRDLNDSDEIESGAELFGSATKLPNGERAENGFEALKPLDSDGDGFITPRDRAWKELQLWVDRNQDGVSQRRELLSLNRLGVESINLNYIQLLEVDEHGNQTRERSTFTRKVHGKRYTLVVTDVWFNSY